MAAYIATNLSEPEDEVILDNQAVTKVLPIPRVRVVVDQDDRDAACQEIKEKHLGLCWAPGHPALEDVHIVVEST